MAKKRSGNGRRVPQYQRDLAAHERMMASGSTLTLDPNPPRSSVRERAVAHNQAAHGQAKPPFRPPPNAPLHPNERGPLLDIPGRPKGPSLHDIKAKPLMSWRTKGGLFGGTAAVGGGALYLHHHRRPQRQLQPVYKSDQRRNTVSKLYDPFSGQTVEFGKKDRPRLVSKTDIPPTGTRYIGALLPTGKHVSHANDFTVAHPKGLKRQTRRSTLQRYTGKGR